MSLANIQGQLSRMEMKKIKGGCGAGCGDALLSATYSCNMAGYDTSTAQGYHAFSNCMGTAYGGFANCILASCAEQPY